MKNRLSMCVVIMIVTMGYCITVFAATNAANNSANLRPLFEERYSAWTSAVSKWHKEHPAASYYPGLPEEQAIFDMGPGVVPFLIEKTEWLLENPSEKIPTPPIRGLICRLTGKNFPPEDYPGGKGGGAAQMLPLYVKWWKEDRKETPKKVAELVVRWDDCKKQGKAKEASEIERRISFLGLDALPLIIEKIKSGDNRFIPIVRDLMNNQTIGGDNPSAESVLKWWEQNKDKYTLPPIEIASPAAAPAQQSK